MMTQQEANNLKDGDRVIRVKKSSLLPLGKPLTIVRIRENPKYRFRVGMQLKGYEDDGYYDAIFFKLVKPIPNPLNIW